MDLPILPIEPRRSRSHALFALVFVPAVAVLFLLSAWMATPAFGAQGPAPAPSPNIADWLFYGACAAAILGSLGGALERAGAANPTGAVYRIGAVLASLGVDLVSFLKVFGVGLPPRNPPSSGSGTPPTKMPANDVKPPVPPAAARMGYRVSARPVGTRIDRFSLAFKRLLWRAPITAAFLAGIVWLGNGANCNGTINPQTQTEVQAAIVLGDCIENVYATDSQKVPKPSWLQFGIDMGSTCGADVPNLVTAFGSSTNPDKAAIISAAQQNEPQVHALAMAHRAEH